VVLIPAQLGLQFIASDNQFIASGNQWWKVDHRQKEEEAEHHQIKNTL